MKLDFREMRLYENIFWKIKLWIMDHRIPLIVTHPSILEPSYYYTHTDEECQAEKNRRIDELMRMIDVLSKKNEPIRE